MKRNWIVIICIVAAVICGAVAVNGYLIEKNAGNSYEELREAVTETQSTSEKAEAVILQEEEETLSDISAEETTSERKDDADEEKSALEKEAVSDTGTGTAAPEEAASDEAEEDALEEKTVSDAEEAVPGDEIVSDAEEAVPGDEIVSDAQEAISEEEEESEVIPIDFDKLQETSPEAYAWIVVPDTQIDYPIVQSSDDNTFYLNHNPEGEYEFAGSIFTENFNTKNFDDPNTVIYGHNMNNGSMFKELHKFEDKVFFEEHPEFVIYMPDEVLHYEIFAAYTYDNRHLMKSYDFSDSEEFRLYLQEILKMKSMGANIREDADVSEDDRIVTLSTCNGINEQRYLVQGVLLSDKN